jgi:hypothetical protein
MLRVASKGLLHLRPFQPPLICPCFWRLGFPDLPVCQFMLNSGLPNRIPLRDVRWTNGPINKPADGDLASRVLVQSEERDFEDEGVRLSSGAGSFIYLLA